MKNKSIDLVNEKTERKELLEWIPMLVKNKLNSLTTAQLRINIIYQDMKAVR